METLHYEIQNVLAMQLNRPNVNVVNLSFSKHFQMKLLHSDWIFPVNLFTD